MSNAQLQGLIVPIVLPMRTDGQPALDELAALCDRFFAAGVAGIWVNGSTGELHDLSPPERAAVVEAVALAADGRGVVIAHVGDTSTKLACAQAEAAAVAGATHVAAVAPYYASFAPAEIASYYEAIAAATDRPLLLYNLPQLVKVTLTHETVLRLASRGAAVGLKDTAGDFSWYRGLLHRLRMEDLPFRCLMGVESLIDVSIVAGGDGAVCTLANLAPRTFVDLVEAAKAGDLALSRQHQADVVSLVQSLALPGRAEWIGSIAALKWVMHELGLLAAPTAAAPVAPLTIAEQQQLAAVALPLAARLIREPVHER
ncbi:dihydrodipicolinate synthase family protein [Tenggerimyces flavus]|uniref:Dihydrodipicolinate synthase family protein n=1 Tax=Tenggerimyces flavus TaxID=1708749 RepID=A0ABV7YCH6_9ACTN|nr:dihydrodipicolinate synthase family protein [Tenggerimyces flavus]MBM7783711.1 4-hydroxy-tetrahydrodipicolinate synthase [Tenggerimyces flavus]